MMARYYVEKDGEWNIFSTVVDDFLFDEFVCLDALKARLLYERFKELTEDMDSLLMDNPRVNVMTYSEAIERRRVDTPQTDAEITELAKEIVHKMIDNSDIAEAAYPDLRQRMHEAVERLDEYYPSEDERSE